MTDSGLKFNATPGNCVVCGKTARQDLCAGCTRQYRDPATRLFPFWLIFLRSDQKRRGRLDAEGREESSGDITDVKTIMHSV